MHLGYYYPRCIIFYNDRVQRKLITKYINNQTYVSISKSELNFNAYILNVNIERVSGYGYHYVVGYGVDASGNLFVYFDGTIKSDVTIIIDYHLVQ